VDDADEHVAPPPKYGNKVVRKKRQPGGTTTPSR
jgi:hypothetical protein